MSDVDQKCGETGTLGNTLGGGGGNGSCPTLLASRFVVVSQNCTCGCPWAQQPAVKVVPGEIQGGGVFTMPRGRRQCECLPGGWGSAVFGENAFQTMDTAWGVGGGQGAFDFRKFVMLGNFKTFSPAATPM